MPRSAFSRSFGFETPAILRILTSADGEEVFKALEILGLVDQIDSEQILQDIFHLGIDITNLIDNIAKVLSVVEFALKVIIAFLLDHTWHPFPHPHRPLIEAQDMLALVQFWKSTLTSRLGPINKRLDEMEKQQREDIARAKRFREGLLDPSKFPFDLPEFKAQGRAPAPSRGL